MAGTRQGSNNDIIGPHAAFELLPDSTWRELPEVPIRGQSVDVHWLRGAGLVVWNYDGQSALMTGSGQWQDLGEVPMASGECHPETTTVRGGLLGHCGGLAQLEARSLTWRRVPSWTPTNTDLDWRYIALPGSVLALVEDGDGELVLMRRSLG